jgi:hypothetical protein
LKNELVMSTINFLRKNLSFAKPFLEALFSIEARASEWWAAGAHRLFLAQWGIFPVPQARAVLELEGNTFPPFC